VYDALTTDRPYKSAWSVEHALDELMRQADCGLWRPGLVETLVEASDANELRPHDAPRVMDPVLVCADSDRVPVVASQR
jgi:HD-GYP domain-containing protein (c-di-GMP phosphodiesterase class II)